jgi:hypothetical protein
MIPPDKHAEAIAALAADDNRAPATKIVERKLVHENSQSATEINRAVAELNRARASLRMALAAAVLVGCGLAVVWTVVLIARWV